MADVLAAPNAGGPPPQKPEPDSPPTGAGPAGDGPAVLPDAHDRLPKVLPTIFPGPPSWPTVFGRQAPLEVELGFGRPHFLLERAAEVPDHNLVGIEWKGRWPRAVWAKQQKGLHPNVRAVHGNAWLLFGAFFAPGSLRALYLNFPDPWWKAKHKKRRIIQDGLVDLIASRLEPGGTLLIQTDVASLLEEILERLEQHPHLKNPAGPARLLPKKPVGASSHREKRCRLDEVPIFRAMVVRSGVPS